ncbi:MAG: glycosyltransferase family 4 protein [Bacteroidales bacterium]|nr:glycosyltransferase family 4 protein [Bacteroidales bacterium]
MNLGFDAKRFFFNNTGLGNYSRTLIYSLLSEFTEHEYYLFSSKTEDYENRFQQFNNLHNISQKSKFQFFWRQLGINKSINQNKIDIYHGLSHEIPFRKNSNNYKSIVTMHDLIYKIYPDLFSKTDAFLYEKKYKSSCNRADKIIAISESTKSDLIKYYNIQEEKIQVVYQTCNPIFTKRIDADMLNEIRIEHNLPSEFILSVGSIIERKNLKDIVKAVGKLPENMRIPIVAVGNGKKYLEEIQEYITENKLEKYFLHYPFISNEHLPAFYQLAKIFVYTSSYEGFGIPVLEALYSETPVISSNISSLPEAGGDSAILVSPNNIDELREAIIKVLENEDLQKQMIQKGITHAKLFTNKQMAIDTMRVYKELI